MIDYNLLGSLGNGAFGEVLLGEKIENKKKYAIKVIDKEFLKREQKKYQVYIEKEVLMRLKHPMLI
jgi:3-phosphoinositide dependent protein kinase-1